MRAVAHVAMTQALIVMQEEVTIAGQ